MDFDDGDFTDVDDGDFTDVDDGDFTSNPSAFQMQDLWDKEVMEMINPYRKLTYEYVKLIELHTLPIQKEYMMRKLWIRLLDIVCLIEKRAKELDKLL